MRKVFTVLDYKLLIQVLLQNIRKRAAAASTQRRDREKVRERERFQSKIRLAIKCHTKCGQERII